jgi:hypothetical protein
LYAISAEEDGTGVVACYILLEPGGRAGYQVDALSKCYQRLKEKGVVGVNFFLTDKDFAQITSAQTVWPDAKVQLCKWHVDDAVRRKMRSTKELKNDKVFIRFIGILCELTSFIYLHAF